MSDSNKPLLALLGLGLCAGLFHSQSETRAQPESHQIVTFQSRVVQGGAPFTGTMTLHFEIHSSVSSTAPLWSETQAGVKITNGILSVRFGEKVTNPLGNLFASGVAPSLDRYVAVKAGGPNGPEIILPRPKLTAVPYAIAASSAGGILIPSGSVLDIAALDNRYVLASGGGAGILRSINNVAPDASGNFGITAGSNMTVTSSANGVVLSSVGGGLDLATADARYVRLNSSYIAAPEVRTTRILTSSGTLAVEVPAPIGPGFPNSPGTLQAGTVFATNNVVASNYVQAPTVNATTLNSQSVSAVNMSASLGMSTHNLTAGGTVTTHTLNATVISAQFKNFVVDHPNDPTKEIVYCSLEGPECAMYARGSAKLKKGKVVVSLPSHFSLLAAPKTITVQVTPTGDCKGLYVKSKAVDKIEVRECQGGKSNVGFDYIVTAKRKGTENHQVIRDKTKSK